MNEEATLNFSEEWYLEKVDLPYRCAWFAGHRHPGTKRENGWYVKRGRCCSNCGVKFPDELLGMLALFNAYESHEEST